MSREKQSKTIGDITFEVVPLPWKKARAVLARLQQVFGPAVAELLRSGTSVKALGDVDTKEVAGALEKFAAGLTEAELDYFCTAFEEGASVSVAGNVALPMKAANTVFDGQLMLMYRWLVFCCEVNFADFLGALVKLAPKSRATEKASPSESLDTSIGSAGES